MKREIPIFRTAKIIRTSRRRPKPIFAFSKTKYGPPPKPIYGPPVPIYGSPPISSHYGPPRLHYGPPPSTFSSFHPYEVPSLTAPISNYGPPLPTYSTLFSDSNFKGPAENFGSHVSTSSNYGTPTPTSGEPLLNYGSFDTPGSSYGASSFSTPTPSYGVPMSNYNTIQSNFPSPPNEYGPPVQSYATPNDYLPPIKNYEQPPVSEYKQPSLTYDLPSHPSSPTLVHQTVPSYNSPSSSYNTLDVQSSYFQQSPVANYDAPSPGYELPSPSYGTPPLSYETPSSSYGTPGAVTSYGTPVKPVSSSNFYQAPSSNYNSPHERNQIMTDYELPEETLNSVTDHFSASSDIFDKYLRSMNNISAADASSSEQNTIINLSTKIKDTSNISITEQPEVSISNTVRNMNQHRPPNHNYDGIGVDDQYSSDVSIILQDMQSKKQNIKPKNLESMLILTENNNNKT